MKRLTVCVFAVFSTVAAHAQTDLSAFAETTGRYVANMIACDKPYERDLLQTLGFVRRHFSAGTLALFSERALAQAEIAASSCVQSRLVAWQALWAQQSMDFMSSFSESSQAVLNVDQPKHLGP
jgi:hypothetical protein